MNFKKVILNFMCLLSAATAGAVGSPATSPGEIYKALDTGNSKQFFQLLETKKFENLKDSFGNTLLMSAIEKDRKAIALKLIEKEKDLNIANKNGETALWLAADLEQTDVVNALLKKKASVDIIVQD